MIKIVFVKYLFIIQFCCNILLIYFFVHKHFPYASGKCPSISKKNTLKEGSMIEFTYNISSNVHIVDLNKPIDADFECVQTKKLVDYVSTIVCLHEKNTDMVISDAFRKDNSIWEEGHITQILQFLIRNPRLDFVDVGANIGSYTMYVAALGRSVVAIECFAPNVARIVKAIQLSGVSNQVVIVQNALFTRSGELLRLSNDSYNIGGQILQVPVNETNQHAVNQKSFKNDPYIMKTVTFDEILPIFLTRGIREVILKMDIEGSEIYVIQNGSRVFDTLEIPLIQMEWLAIRLYAGRGEVIIDFFTQRNYNPMTLTCSKLDPMRHRSWPDEIFWIKKNRQTFC